jgi:hypothetical protein
MLSERKAGIEEKSSQNFLVENLEDAMVAV